MARLFQIIILLKKKGFEHHQQSIPYNKDEIAYFYQAVVLNLSDYKKFQESICYFKKFESLRIFTRSP